MSLQPVATALARAQDVLTRRPGMGLHDDAPATARWEGGTRNVATHANGTSVATDMATELGGGGERVTPGWLFRAGVASCTVTIIAMRAAMEGVALTALEARVASRTDARGLLGMKGEDGIPVNPGPCEIHLHVRIAAAGAAPDTLRSLVDRACRCSPMASAVTSITPLDVHVEIA